MHGAPIAKGTADGCQITPIPPCSPRSCYREVRQGRSCLQCHMSLLVGLSMFFFAYRVTFALEEKNLPYDSVLIELRNKPHWYKDIVPTELTPAAVINGDLVYESLDILKVRTALIAFSLTRHPEALSQPNMELSVAQG